MYDIKALEEEWKQYRKRGRRVWYLSGLLLLIIIGVVFAVLKKNLFYFSDSVQKDRNTTIVEREQNSKVEIPGKEEVIKIIEDIPVLDEVAKGKTSESSIVENKSVQSHRKIHLNIIKTSNIRAYKDVEERFYQSHDPADSIFLARIYYNKGKYLQAENWALRTNKVNADIEESWIIFAKSKAKQGYKNEAIGVLVPYIKRTNSSVAKDVLYKIKNDTL